MTEKQQIHQSTLKNRQRDENKNTKKTQSSTSFELHVNDRVFQQQETGFAI